MVTYHSDIPLQPITVTNYHGEDTTVIYHGDTDCKLTPLPLVVQSERAPYPWQLSHVDTRIVSLTVTEKGYCQDVNGDLDRVRGT